MRTIDIRQKERAERVAALLAKSGLKPAELAKKLGVARAAAAKWYRGASAPTGARLEALASLLGVSVNFIRTGKDDGAAPASDCLYIPVLPLNGGSLFGVVDALRLNADALKSLGLKPESIALFLIDSDAMAPAIPADAIALVDTSTDAPASRGAFSEGIYLIENTEGARRLARLIYTPAGAVFISDNPAYQRDPVPVDKTTIRGRVKALIRVEII